MSGRTRIGSLVIRRAQPGDSESLLPLLDQLGYRSELDDVRPRLERLLAAPDSKVLVAESEGQLVGLVTFHVFELIYRPRPQCRLTALVVDENHRRRGIGARLVEAVHQAAREHGCFRVELTTRTGRGEAIPFYTALGFTERPHRFVRMLD
jgi:GNAT superfamily N-acetyltransferase